MAETISGYRFADYLLDLSSKSLFRGDERIDLPERNFQLLVLLAQRSPELVSKEEISEALWKNTVVSEWSLFRLISDTRQLLGDDGDNQNIIRTTRGAGFFIADCDAVTDNSAQSKEQGTDTSLKGGRIKPWQMSVLALLVVVIGALALIYPSYKHQQLLESAQRISQLQDNTYTMFLAQVTRRNELVSMIEKRTGQKRDREFEKFFALHYPEMTEQELFVFAQIRAMTEKGLYEYNSAILAELQQNPELYDEIDKTFDLQQHLEFWLKKYNNLFKTREDMCLLYVGVEDGVPYPTPVDKNVKSWIAANNGDAD